MGRDVITIASALVLNGCDVIASLQVERAAQPYPKAIAFPYTPYSILHTLIASSLVNGASGPPSLYSRAYFSPSTKKLLASRRREQPMAVTKVTSRPVAVMRRHQEGSFEP